MLWFTPSISSTSTMSSASRMVHRDIFLDSVPYAARCLPLRLQGGCPCPLWARCGWGRPSQPPPHAVRPAMARAVQSVRATAPTGAWRWPCAGVRHFGAIAAGRGPLRCAGRRRLASSAPSLGALGPRVCGLGGRCGGPEAACVAAERFMLGGVHGGRGRRAAGGVRRNEWMGTLSLRRLWCALRRNLRRAVWVIVP